ncbi:MAG: iron-sulfur protein [Actinomycetia bacterium]|nr:iron-sulfur protein [Actinomycetes bacterium]
MDLAEVTDRIAAADHVFDPVGKPVADAVRAVLPQGPVRDALQGTWLGHPLHPMLTDVVIGAWTSSFLLDFVGGHRSRRASERLLAVGILAAVPTVASGLADWSTLQRRDQRVGLVHAASNAAATGTYFLSYRARRKGHHLRGVAWGVVGATVASVGGYLGGHLAYSRDAGANHSLPSEGPVEWTEVDVGPNPAREGPIQVDVEGAKVVVAHDEDGLHALGDICSHQGGPLHEGELVDSCIRCPWHGSEFRLRDGSVRHGPAAVPEPLYEVRDGDPVALRMVRPSVPAEPPY